MKDKDTKDTKNTLERRTIPVEDVELRVERDADGKPTKISGYAAVFNKDSVVMWGWVLKYSANSAVAEQIVSQPSPP